MANLLLPFLLCYSMQGELHERQSTHSAILGHSYISKDTLRLMLMLAIQVHRSEKNTHTHKMKERKI